MRRLPLPVVPWALAVLALVTSACTARASAAPAPTVYALLINGGGSVEENYSSHLAHLRQMNDLLRRAGLPSDRITVLNADGADPHPDMAARDRDPPGLTYLENTDLGARLGRGMEYRSSSLPGVSPLPATRASLDRWFASARSRLHAGDTLLLYVTDHGTQNEQDHLDNRIVLWGRRESISVRQLRVLLEKLDPGVRVVTLMSQCFSGGFARLLDTRARAGVPTGNTCGYFSSTPDRPAYGCYPEAAGRERIGHSFEFMEALGERGRFSDAHAAVLVTDTTPDVPLRTSDVYLAGVVERAAKAQGKKMDEVTDTLLREAWQDRARWEPEIRLLDRIGHAYGLPSPRTLGELSALEKRLDQLEKPIDTYGEDWSVAHRYANIANQRRFFDTHSDWAVRVSGPTLKVMSPEARAKLVGQLGTALAAEAARDPVRAKRIETLAARNATGDEAAYRMEVREAVLLRLRALLTDVAARTLLARSPADAAGYEALRRCEDFTLPLSGGAAPAPPPFPPLEDENKVVEALVPAWMGIAFDDGPSARRARRNLSDGAAWVTSVLPNSPALAAGLRPGDIVLGTPGQPFDETGRIKSWTMLLPVRKPQQIEVLRDDQKMVLTIVPQPRALDLPKLGPPRPAAPAPPVRGLSYRGAAPDAVTAKGSYLVIFWATWCGFCKQSLPEVMAFSRARGVPIVAVTDEGRSELDAFFAHWRAPFPDNVVSDQDRVSFDAYAVSGMPTFVLVDAAHKVRHYFVGYDREKGLPITGWRWDGQPK